MDTSFIFDEKGLNLITAWRFGIPIGKATLLTASYEILSFNSDASRCRELILWVGACTLLLHEDLGFKRLQKYR